MSPSHPSYYEGMSTVNKSYLEGLLQAVTAARMIGTKCVSFHPSKNAKHTLQAWHRPSSGLQPHTCDFALAGAQLHNSCVSGCLSLASCLERRTRRLHPPTGLSFPTLEALQVHSRLASSVDKGDRSDSVTVTMFIYGKYILSTNGSKKVIQCKPLAFPNK